MSKKKICYWLDPDGYVRPRDYPDGTYSDYCGGNNLNGSPRPEEVTCERCLALLSAQPRPDEQRAPDSGDVGAGTKSVPASAVDRPAHYTAGGVECIDAIDAAVAHLNGAEGFYVGQVIKYVWRWKLKNGVEDLKKCRWYLDRLISKLEAK